MAAPDPIALRRHASRIVSGMNAEARSELRVAPALAIRQFFGLEVVFASASGCGLDASYDRASRTITVSDLASDSRQRFSCLHELGHHLIDVDSEAQDWLYARGGEHDAAAEEQLADAIAAAILIPDALIDEHLSQPVKARALVRFFDGQEYASREACCVRAAQLLDRNGMVVLSRDATVLFAAPRNLGYRIRRGTEQSLSSVFARAARSGFATANHEHVHLGSSLSGATFEGQASTSDDGYTFAVLTESLTEVDRDGRPQRSVWICHGCNSDISDEPWCSSCTRRECPDCGCNCEPATLRRPEVCTNCFLEIPPAKSECPNCN